MKIHRLLIDELQNNLIQGKVLVLYGHRQAGKTTLAQDLLASTTLRTKFVNADELLYREALASQDLKTLNEVLGNAEWLIIDEAQRVPEIGLNLKILVDNNPNVTILATGSASFELANKISEPLTGRKLTFTLYPLRYAELSKALGALETRNQLERWMVWGGYPVVATTNDRALRERLLGELVGSYLYRDILELGEVRRSEKLVDLLRLLAYQFGQEVSLAELGASPGLSRDTVERYLDLLEKVFVIFRVEGFSRNLRKEVTKNSRYYFFDNGVRNSLVQNLKPIPVRNDTGQLRQNFLMVERRKANQLARRSVNAYFWRTYDQKEIDYIEEYAGQLNAYEFKWGDGEIKASTRKTFMEAYPEAKIHIVNRDAFEGFVG